MAKFKVWTFVNGGFGPERARVIEASCAEEARSRVPRGEVVRKVKLVRGDP